MMGPTFWLVVVASSAVVLLTALLLWRADHAADDRVVGVWAEAHGLRLTPTNRPFVRYYLVLGRVLRTLGGVGGLMLGGLVGAATGLDVARGFLWWVWAMGGYLAGAIWAELFLTRPRSPARAASLVPRRLPDYLPARLRWALRVAGVASLATGLAGWAVRAPSATGRVGSSDLHYPLAATMSPGAALGLGLTGAALAALVELLQVRIVRRPQPVVATDLREADDAVRASSVHSLAGAGLGMVVLILATVTARLVDVSGPLPFGLGWAPLALSLVGLLGWRYYPHRPWRVHRPDPLRPAAP